jgi:hypothetical protein
MVGRGDAGMCAVCIIVVQCCAYLTPEPVSHGVVTASGHAHGCGHAPSHACGVVEEGCVGGGGWVGGGGMAGMCAVRTAKVW